MGLLNICIDFRTSWPTMEVFWEEEANGGGRCDIDLQRTR